MRRLLSRIDTFGFHLATLDLRAHTAVHHAVLAQGLDDPRVVPAAPRPSGMRGWSRCSRRDTGPSGSFDALGKRTLAVFDAIVQSRHRYGPDAIGLYIVGGAAQADDVLAPLVLARWAEAYDKSSGEVALDVAPQFDTVGDARALRRGDARAARGWGLQAPPRSARPLQTVLIGYSDSNQESGIVASRFAAYRAQRHLTEALRQAQQAACAVLQPRRQHPARRRAHRRIAAGRAGRIGQRRAALHRAGRKHQPELRPASQRHAHAGARVFSTLALATLAVKRGVAVRESAALAECAGLVAGHSAQAWRSLIYEQPQFVDFFRAVTPIDVIERMQIGAQPGPAARGGRHRCGAAGGVGVRLGAVAPHAARLVRSRQRGWNSHVPSAESTLLRRCYQGWPFFRNLIDDIEAMLARADFARGRAL